MQISDVHREILSFGIPCDAQTLRRRIDVYLDSATRNQRSNYRDIDEYELDRLKKALAVESLGYRPAEVLKFLDGHRPKNELLNSLMNSHRIHEFIKNWIKEA